VLIFAHLGEAAGDLLTKRH